MGDLSFCFSENNPADVRNSTKIGVLKEWHCYNTKNGNTHVKIIFDTLGPISCDRFSQYVLPIT